MSPTVVLIGLPGTGKTSAGQRLAKILAVPFADSDQLVERADGRSVRRIFADDGEPAFRVAEAKAVEAALRDFRGVLALGGGALGSAATRAALAGSDVPVAVLRATLDTLGARVGDGRSRPLLAGAPRERLAELADERGPLYAELATFEVDTDGKTPGQVAATIAARLYRRRREVHA
ncbi:shikimate kinase [uncultured Jatrophihabitans sp.]|uniref:shikimate kinase n=1 Tax=uncultured Jatrophihabitans sp. TaxID=1610747 RepID=UPI0035CBFC4F